MKPARAQATMPESTRKVQCAPPSRARTALPSRRPSRQVSRIHPRRVSPGGVTLRGVSGSCMSRPVGERWASPSAPPAVPLPAQPRRPAQGDSVLPLVPACPGGVPALSPRRPTVRSRRHQPGLDGLRGRPAAIAAGRVAELRKFLRHFPACLRNRRRCCPISNFESARGAAAAQIPCPLDSGSFSVPLMPNHVMSISFSLFP